MPPGEKVKMHLTHCPACDYSKFVTLFTYHEYSVQQCLACGLVFLTPQPTDEVLTKIYSADYFLGSQSPVTKRFVSHIKHQTARLYLDKVAQYGSPPPGKLLEVGCGHGELLMEAVARGYSVRGLDMSPHAVRMANDCLGRELVACATPEQAGLPAAEFDVCVCVDMIEHTRDPLTFLAQVHRVLKPGGVLLLVTPTIDSWMARWLKRHWFEFKIEHLYYFSRATVQNVLARTGFRSVEVSGNHKVLTLDYLYRHFMRYRVPGLSTALEALSRVTPRPLRHHLFKMATSSITVLARAEVVSSRPVVSVIVPAYNEYRYVSQVMDRLIAKQLTEMDKEIIVVEGNSSDGTREAVLNYQGTPGVEIVLLDRAQGKGHAVRHGLARATGDFVLIQDADLEYDIDDYEALLEPLRTYRQAFVLGSRHSGNWQIRKFAQRSLMAMMLNLGHWLFTTLFNWLYGQKLSDPWTMYKVFRRDCLHRMRLECNRFDFDHELVAKLVRRGFSPIEIPVNYRSRSFAEGKKIRIFHDPPTWLWACVKYRIMSPDKPRARVSDVVCPAS